MHRSRTNRMLRRTAAPPTHHDEYDALLARARAEARPAPTRRGLWDELVAIFRGNRPTEDQLSEVSVVAEVAIDQVFATYKLSEAQQVERHGAVKDFAECAALYGYALGYERARRERAA